MRRGSLPLRGKFPLRQWRNQPINPIRLHRALLQSTMSSYPRREKNRLASWPKRGGKERTKMTAAGIVYPAGRLSMSTRPVMGSIGKLTLSSSLQRVSASRQSIISIDTPNHRWTHIIVKERHQRNEHTQDDRTKVPIYPSASISLATVDQSCERVFHLHHHSSRIQNLQFLIDRQSNIPSSINLFSASLSSSFHPGGNASCPPASVSLFRAPYHVLDIFFFSTWPFSGLSRKPMGKTG